MEFSEPETLEDIRTDLGECTRCPLHQGRKHIVFGEGPATARVMFVGEGPGRDEDRQGVPFVGAAGQLLTDIIVKGMKLRREDCYIGNIVKCRPPQNRDPHPDEANACLPFLKRQIAVIQPEVIVALGRIAAHYLLNQDLPLARLRNRFHKFEGIPVMPTYHPAALLRDPRRKRDTWEDIKLVLAKLNLPA
jgi:DNA polymerase